jgi:hypothetical protein
MSNIEGSEPDWHTYEGRSERTRAVSEFQIVEDLQAALAQFGEIADNPKP